jgi:hypothetical protein
MKFVVLEVFFYVKIKFKEFAFLPCLIRLECVSVAIETSPRSLRYIVGGGRNMSRRCVVEYVRAHAPMRWLGSMNTEAKSDRRRC